MSKEPCGSKIAISSQCGRSPIWGKGVDSEFGRVHQAMSAELACASVADRIWRLVTSFTQATPQPVSRHTA